LIVRSAAGTPGTDSRPSR